MTISWTSYQHYHSMDVSHYYQKKIEIMETEKDAPSPFILLSQFTGYLKCTTVVNSCQLLSKRKQFTNFCSQSRWLCIKRMIQLRQKIFIGPVIRILLQSGLVFAYNGCCASTCSHYAIAAVRVIWRGIQETITSVILSFLGVIGAYWGVY